MDDRGLEIHYNGRWEWGGEVAARSVLDGFCPTVSATDCFYSIAER